MNLPWEPFTGSNVQFNEFSFFLSQPSQVLASIWTHSAKIVKQGSQEEFPSFLGTNSTTNVNVLALTSFSQCSKLELSQVRLRLIWNVKKYTWMLVELELSRGTLPVVTPRMRHLPPPPGLLPFPVGRVAKLVKGNHSVKGGFFKASYFPADVLNMGPCSAIWKILCVKRRIS